MAARRACRSLSLDPQRDLTRVGGMLRIKASCAMSEGRSSRGTRSGLSKSAERIPSGDESGKPRVAIRHERREATPIGRRLDCRRFRSFNGGWPHAAGKSMRVTSLFPGAAKVGRARHRYRNQNSAKLRISPIKTVSAG